LADPGVQKRLADLGLEIPRMTSRRRSSLILQRRDREVVPIIKAANIKASDDWPAAIAADLPHCQSRQSDQNELAAQQEILETLIVLPDQKSPIILSVGVHLAMPE